MEFLPLHLYVLYWFARRNPMSKKRITLVPAESLRAQAECIQQAIANLDRNPVATRLLKNYRNKLLKEADDQETLRIVASGFFSKE